MNEEQHKKHRDNGELIYLEIACLDDFVSVPSQSSQCTQSHLNPLKLYASYQLKPTIFPESSTSIRGLNPFFFA